MKINTNCVIVTGNLVRDAELRYTANQRPVLNFTIAVNRKFGAEQVADFFPCVSWSKSAEQLEQYMTKGKQVLVKGHLQTRSYENREGIKVNVTEIYADEYGGIELLGGGDDRHGAPRYGSAPQPPAQSYRQTPEQGAPRPSAPRPQEQGDIPF